MPPRVDTPLSVFRRRMNIIGFTVLSVPVVQIVLAAVISAFMIVLMTAGLIPSLSTNDSTMLLTGIIYPVSYLAGLLLVPILTRFPLKSLLPFRRTDAGYFLTVPAMTLGVGAIGSCLSMLISSLTSALGAVSYSNLPGPSSYSFGDIFFYLLVLAVMPAFFEEFLFRGAVLSLLRPYGDGFAVLTSAVLFSMMHGNLEQMPAAFLIGLLFGYVAVTTGSLWPGILAHFTNNLIASVTGLWFGAMSEQDAALFSLLTYVVFLAVGLLGAVVFLRRQRRPLSRERLLPGLTGGRKLAQTALRPGMILFGLLCLYLVYASFRPIYG